MSRKVLFTIFCLLSILILWNISSVISLSLNTRYAVKDIKYIQTPTEAEGIQQIIEQDYKEVILYLLIQILMVMVIIVLLINYRMRFNKIENLKHTTQK